MKIFEISLLSMFIDGVELNIIIKLDNLICFNE